jgi:hypothetical protein
MENFECLGGPFARSRLACKFKPYEGAREVVYHVEDGLTLEACYELRRHKTVELIAGDGVWQWHYVPPNSWLVRGLAETIGEDLER